MLYEWMYLPLFGVVFVQYSHILHVMSEKRNVLKIIYLDSFSSVQTKISEKHLAVGISN